MKLNYEPTKLTCRLNLYKRSDVERRSFCYHNVLSGFAYATGVIGLGGWPAFTAAWDLVEINL